MTVSNKRGGASETRGQRATNLEAGQEGQRALGGGKRKGGQVDERRKDDEQRLGDVGQRHRDERQRQRDEAADADEVPAPWDGPEGPGDVDDGGEGGRGGVACLGHGCGGES